MSPVSYVFSSTDDERCCSDSVEFITSVKELVLFAQSALL